MLQLQQLSLSLDCRHANFLAISTIVVLYIFVGAMYKPTPPSSPSPPWEKDPASSTGEGASRISRAREKEDSNSNNIARKVNAIHNGDQWCR